MTSYVQDHTLIMLVHKLVMKILDVEILGKARGKKEIHKVAQGNMVKGQGQNWNWQIIVHEKKKEKRK